MAVLHHCISYPLTKDPGHEAEQLVKAASQGFCNSSTHKHFITSVNPPSFMWSSIAILNVSLQCMPYRNDEKHITLFPALIISDNALLSDSFLLSLGTRSDDYLIVAGIVDGHGILRSAMSSGYYNVAHI